MGRAARAKHTTPRKPIKLEPVEYYKLRTLIRDKEQVMAAAQASVQAAVAKQNEYLTHLGQTYAIPADFETMQWNDETLEFSFT